MPFQGNPKAGAPDPAFLNFLFNRQDARAKAERQSGLDRAKAIAEIADQKRKSEIHSLDVAAKEAALLKANREANANLADEFSAAGQNASREVDALDQQEIAQSFEPGPALAAPNAPGAPPNQAIEQANFAQILSANDPGLNLNDPSVLGARDDQVQGIFSEANEAPARRNAEIAKARGVTPEQNFADAQSIRGSVGVKESRVLATKIAEEERASKRAQAATVKAAEVAAGVADVSDKRKRAAATKASERAIKAAEVAHDRVVSRTVDIARSVNAGLREEIAAVKNASTPEEFEAAQMNLDSLRAEKLRREYVNAPDSLVGKREGDRKLVARYRGQVEQMRVLNMIASRPELLGPQANVSALMQNVRGLGVDMKAIFQPQYLELIQSDLISQEDKEFLNQVFIREQDGNGEAIQRVRLEEVRLLWSLLLAQNPSGRQLKSQVDLLREAISFSGPLTSSSLAVSRIKAAASQIRTALPREQDNLSGISGPFPEMTFDAVTGRIVGDRPAPIFGLGREGGSAAADENQTFIPQPDRPRPPRGITAADRRRLLDMPFDPNAGGN